MLVKKNWGYHKIFHLGEQNILDRGLKKFQVKKNWVKIYWSKGILDQNEIWVKNRGPQKFLVKKLY